MTQAMQSACVICGDPAKPSRRTVPVCASKKCENKHYTSITKQKDKQKQSCGMISRSEAYRLIESVRWV